MRVQILKKIERATKFIKRKTFKIMIGSTLIGVVIMFNIGQAANAIVSDVTPATITSTSTIVADTTISTGTTIVNSTDTNTVNATGTTVIDTSKKFSINGLLLKDDNSNTPFIVGDVTMYNSFGGGSGSVFNCLDIGTSIDFSESGTTTTVDDGVQISYVITREGDSNYREVLEDMNTSLDKYYRHGSYFDHVSWNPWKVGIYDIQAIAKDKYGNTETSTTRKVTVIEDENSRNFIMQVANGFYGARQYVEDLTIDRSSCNIGDAIKVNVKLDTADKLGENFSQSTICKLVIKDVNDSFNKYMVYNPPGTITERNISYIFDGKHGIGEGTYNISLIIEPKYYNYNYNYDSNAIEYTIYDGFVVKSATDTITYSEPITVATVSTSTINSVPVATKQTSDVIDGTNANINGTGTLPTDTSTIGTSTPISTATISTTTPPHIRIPFTGDTENGIIIMVFFLSGIGGIFISKKNNSVKIK